MLDFSTGVSPLPPPPRVLAALREADVMRYPHPTALELREAIAASHGALDASEVVAGNGSAELIWALARVYCGPGRTGLVLTPAFGEYAQAIRASGGALAEQRASGPPFHWDVDSAVRKIEETRPSLIFACRPSNPCLSAFSLDTVAAIARAAPDALLVIDEAYLPLFTGVLGAHRSANVAVLRSLTKVFALPGLRLGYLLASRDVAKSVQSALPPWNVSRPAIAAGCAALADREAVSDVRERVQRLRQMLVKGLQHAAPSLRIDAEGGPFIICHVKSAAQSAQALASRNIWVRDCTSFGLPQHLRIGVRPEEELHALFQAFAETRDVHA